MTDDPVKRPSVAPDLRQLLERMSLSSQLVNVRAAAPRAEAAEGERAAWPEPPVEGSAPSASLFTVDAPPAAAAEGVFDSPSAIAGTDGLELAPGAPVRPLDGSISVQEQPRLIDPSNAPGREPPEPESNSVLEPSPDLAAQLRPPAPSALGDGSRRQSESSLDLRGDDLDSLLLSLGEPPSDGSAPTPPSISQEESPAGRSQDSREPVVGLRSKGADASGRAGTERDMSAVENLPAGDLENALASLLDVQSPIKPAVVEIERRGQERSETDYPASTAAKTASAALSQEQPASEMVEVDLSAKLTLGGLQGQTMDVKILALALGSAVVSVPTIDLLPSSVSHHLTLALPGMQSQVTAGARILQQRGELDEQGHARQLVQLELDWPSPAERQAFAAYYSGLVEQAEPMQPVAANVKIEVLDGPRKGTQFLGKSTYVGRSAIQCTVDGFDMEQGTHVRFSLIAPRFVEQLTFEDGVVGATSPGTGRKMEVQIDFASPHDELNDFVAKYFAQKPSGVLPFLSRFRR